MLKIDDMAFHEVARLAELICAITWHTLGESARTDSRPLYTMVDFGRGAKKNYCGSRVLSAQISLPSAEGRIHREICAKLYLTATGAWTGWHLPESHILHLLNPGLSCKLSSINRLDSPRLPQAPARTCCGSYFSEKLIPGDVCGRNRSAIWRVREPNRFRTVDSMNIDPARRYFVITGSFKEKSSLIQMQSFRNLINWEDLPLLDEPSREK